MISFGINNTIHEQFINHLNQFDVFEIEIYDFIKDIEIHISNKKNIILNISSLLTKNKSEISNIYTKLQLIKFDSNIRYLIIFIDNITEKYKKILNYINSLFNNILFEIHNCSWKHYLNREDVFIIAENRFIDRKWIKNIYPINTNTDIKKISDQIKNKKIIKLYGTLGNGKGSYNSDNFIQKLVKELSSVNDNIEVILCNTYIHENKITKRFPLGYLNYLEYKLYPIDNKDVYTNVNNISEDLHPCIYDIYTFRYHISKIKNVNQ